MDWREPPTMPADSPPPPILLAPATLTVISRTVLPAISNRAQPHTKMRRSPVEVPSVINISPGKYSLRTVKASICVITASGKPEKMGKQWSSVPANANSGWSWRLWMDSKRRNSRGNSCKSSSKASASSSQTVQAVSARRVVCHTSTMPKRSMSPTPATGDLDPTLKLPICTPSIQTDPLPRRMKIMDSPSTPSFVMCAPGRTVRSSVRSATLPMKASSLSRNIGSSRSFCCRKKRWAFLRRKSPAASPPLPRCSSGTPSVRPLCTGSESCDSVLPNSTLLLCSRSPRTLVGLGDWPASTAMAEVKPKARACFASWECGVTAAWWRGLPVGDWPAGSDVAADTASSSSIPAREIGEAGTLRPSFSRLCDLRRSLLRRADRSSVCVALRGVCCQAPTPEPPAASTCCVAARLIGRAVWSLLSSSRDVRVARMALCGERSAFDRGDMPWSARGRLTSTRKLSRARPRDWRKLKTRLAAASPSSMRIICPKRGPSKRRGAAEFA
mmetsp:Transcript_31318/g.91328  ORF Transcript_31318/g.91328 Transcript_31318/m.91328 type:complete len:501 (+) Transcript_31318:1928-3430(+)